MVGMTLVSSGEFASEVTIISLDLGNNQLTVSGKCNSNCPKSSNESKTLLKECTFSKVLLLIK
jgi:hypothetical protein